MIRTLEPFCVAGRGTTTTTTVVLPTAIGTTGQTPTTTTGFVLPRLFFAGIAVLIKQERANKKSPVSYPEPQSRSI